MAQDNFRNIIESGGKIHPWLRSQVCHQKGGTDGFPTKAMMCSMAIRSVPPLSSYDFSCYS